MKTILTIVFMLGVFISTVKAQDYMFVHQKGKIITTIATGEIDSIIFYPAPGEDTITDIEGNVYNTITIGTQIWMKENLKTTQYNDGTDIPLESADSMWISIKTPGYCWYENSKSVGKTYGALYNWYTVNTGKLCPAEWHVPVNAEWTMLTSYLGGESGAGDKLKESGTTHWIGQNSATNETGFTALPGGCRGNSGAFYSFGETGYWWSATEDGEANAWNCYMYYGAGVGRSNYYVKEYGYSVRCVKD
jgi:uncharacterized protein (TIGR02145 family)